jgi:uncharacterized protein (TIGR02145 family)
MKLITETLKNIIAQYGIDILWQDHRLKALLADLLPKEKRLRYLLDLSLRAEIPRKLIAMQNESSSSFETQVNAMRHYFKEQYFLEEAGSKLIFDCWVELLISDVNTVTDIDGNVYNIIKIGTQKWLVENLKTTRYRNGDLIGTTFPINKNIFQENNPKYQWSYWGDESNANKYGRLYTWYSATDLRCIAPEGWRVPSDNDWAVLIKYLIANGYNYDNSKSGNKVAKSLAANSDWTDYKSPGVVGNNLYKNNSSGFTAFPGGVRHNLYNEGYFCQVGEISAWWSCTEFNNSHARYISLTNSNNNAISTNGLKSTGYSIRCVKDL